MHCLDWGGARCYERIPITVYPKELKNRAFFPEMVQCSHWKNSSVFEIRGLGIHRLIVKDSWGATWHYGIPEEERHSVPIWYENCRCLYSRVLWGPSSLPHLVIEEKWQNNPLFLPLSVSHQSPTFSYTSSQTHVHRQTWLRGSLFPHQIPGQGRMTFTLRSVHIHMTSTKDRYSIHWKQMRIRVKTFPQSR